MRDRGAQPLQATVWVHDGALLLGGRLGGEDHVGVLGQAVGEHRRMRDDQAGMVHGGLPGGPVRKVAHRVGLEQVQGAHVAGVRGRRGDLGGATPGRGRLDVGVPGARVGEGAGLPHPTPVGAPRDLEEAGARPAREPQRLGDPRQRRERLGVKALAPQDHHVLTAVGQLVGERRRVVRGALAGGVLQTRRQRG